MIFINSYNNFRLIMRLLIDTHEYMFNLIRKNLTTIKHILFSSNKKWIEVSSKAALRELVPETRVTPPLLTVFRSRTDRPVILLRVLHSTETEKPFCDFNARCSLLSDFVGNDYFHFINDYPIATNIELFYSRVKQYFPCVPTVSAVTTRPRQIIDVTHGNLTMIKRFNRTLHLPRPIDRRAGVFTNRPIADQQTGLDNT